MNKAGIAFSGYPGLIADLTGTPRGQSFMMLVGKGLHGEQHPAGFYTAPDAIKSFGQHDIETTAKCAGKNLLDAGADQ